MNVSNHFSIICSYNIQEQKVYFATQEEEVDSKHATKSYCLLFRISGLDLRLI